MTIPEWRVPQLSSAEAVAADKRAQKAGGARGALIRRVAIARMEVTKATTIQAVLNNMRRIEEAQEAVRDNAELEALTARETIDPEALQEGMKKLDDMGLQIGYMDAGLQDAALSMKDKAGKALLEEHLPAARQKVDDIVSEAFFERQTTLGALMAPEHMRDAVARYRKSVGGNRGASDTYFEEAIASGDFRDMADASRQLRTKAGKRKINARYQAWLREKAMEAEPALRDDMEAARETGQKIIDLAREATGLTPREATQKASRHIGRGANLRGVTSRAGWAAKDYDRDVVDLMQIAGKIVPSDSHIYIGSQKDVAESTGRRIKGGKGRSFHYAETSMSIGRVQDTHVCLAGSVGKGILFHEVGHAIEAVNPVANAAVSRWLKGRIEGEESKSLSRLTGVGAYGRNEVAVKDSFVDPYIGKIYRPRSGIQSNEVLAMGLERLADPMQAAALAAQDPDHLALVLSVLQMEYQP